MQPPVVPNFPRRRKSGAGCLVQSIAIFALAGVLMMAFYAVFMPWAFYMGGRFRLFPQWQGWGRLHSNIAGDYVLYVSLSPSTNRGGAGSSSHGKPQVSGRGFLCTSRGEMYRLSLGGSFDKPSGTDLQGKAAYIYMNHYSAFGGSNAPSLEFRGKWNNPDLIMDDHGSINRAFDPDGVLARNNHMRPYIQEVVPITLHEGPYSDFSAACSALKKK
jgi:hypothetical protein